METVLFFKTQEINSVAGFVKHISRTKFTGKYLFRGQNIDMPLLPKIARNPNMNRAEIEDIERKMLNRFKKESTPFLSAPFPSHDWNWLSIAQHQGMPTRLLDWSANALAALWFAVASDPPSDVSEGVLWKLKVSKSNLKSPEESNDVFNLRRTYVFQPFHIDKRIAAQSGWFSVHKYAERSDKYVALDSNNKYKDHLFKYVVPRRAFKKIRQELRLLGVTQATMFPDLAGLSADIQAEYLGNEPDAEKI